MELALQTTEAIHDMRRDPVLRRAMHDAGITAKAVAMSAVGKSMTGGLQVPVFMGDKIVDIAAFNMRRPTEWSLLTMAGRTLGEGVLLNHQMNRDAPPLYLHEDVVDWMRWNCVGSLVLFPSTLPAELIGVREVVVSEAFAPRLHAMLTKAKLANPKILVRDRKIAEAAE